MVEAHSLSKILEKIDSDLPRKVVLIKKKTVEESIGFITALDMNTPIRYQKVRVQENRNTKLIGLLLAHPDAPISKNEIVNHLNYFHHRSGEAVDFFCVGYGAYWPKEQYLDQIKATSIDGVDWFYSDKAFTKVVDELESETKWSYSGETELLLITARKGKDGKTFLDYGTAVVCNLEAMSNDKAFTSVRSFFEGVFKFAKQNIASNETWALSDQNGLQVGKSAIKEAVLSLLPKNLRESYKKAEHYVVKNIE